MISVIIPIYNTEKYLEECIISVLQQTYSDLEVILVDDGSTDESYSICSRYALKDNRIQVIRQENQGISAARNAGVKASRGEYVFFLDSDDYLEEDALRVLLDLIENSDADLGVASIRHVDMRGEEIAKECFQDEKSLLDDRSFWKVVYSKTMGVTVWSKLYKSEMVKRCEFPVGKINEDECYINDIMSKVQKIACTADIVLNYRRREESITHSPGKERLDKCWFLLERFELLKQKGYSEYYYPTFAVGSAAMVKYYKSSEGMDVHELEIIRKKYRNWAKELKPFAKGKEKLMLWLFIHNWSAYCKIKRNV